LFDGKGHVVYRLHRALVVGFRDVCYVDHQNLTSPYIPILRSPSFFTRIFVAYTRFSRSSFVWIVFGVNSALSLIHSTVPGYSRYPPWASSTNTATGWFSLSWLNCGPVT